MRQVARALLFGTMALLASHIAGAEKPPDRAAAVRLNNIGVAYMNQQRMDKAVEEFDAALRADPGFSIAELNKGIALLNLQKLPQAEAAMDKAVQLDPSNPRVWYNRGLILRSGKAADAIDAFQRVAKIDPNDPDTHYFLGALYSQLQEYTTAIAEFETALRLQPLHASAEFGLARALQRAGDTQAARQHLQNFEHLTQTKASVPLTLSYGEQGRYSIAQQVTPTQPKVGPMIPVSFVEQPLGTTTARQAITSNAGGGICMLDVTGEGHFDLVAMRSESTLFGCTTERTAVGGSFQRNKQASMPAAPGFLAQSATLTMMAGTTWLSRLAIGCCYLRILGAASFPM